MSELMTPLETLASEINELHDQIVGAMRTTVDLAIKCGEKLAEVRDQVPNFKAWCETDFGGGRTTAYKFLKLHERRDLLCSPGEHVGVNEAYVLVTKAEKAAKQAEQADADLAAIDAAEADIASPDLGRIDSEGSPTPPVVESDARTRVAKLGNRLDTAQAVVGGALAEVSKLVGGAEGSERVWLKSLEGVLQDAQELLTEFVESAMTGGDE